MCRTDSRKICSFFYRKREKQRILFIYNNALKARKNFIRRIRDVIKELASEAMLTQKPGEQLFGPRKLYKCCAWLKIFDLKKCKLCGKTESCWSEYLLLLKILLDILFMYILFLQQKSTSVY